MERAHLLRITDLGQVPFWMNLTKLITTHMRKQWQWLVKNPHLISIGSMRVSLSSRWTASESLIMLRQRGRINLVGLIITLIVQARIITCSSKDTCYTKASVPRHISSHGTCLVQSCTLTQNRIWAREMKGQPTEYDQAKSVENGQLPAMALYSRAKKRWGNRVRTQ